MCVCVQPWTKGLPPPLFLPYMSRGTQHFTGTVSTEATSEMGYPAWPAGRTCSVFHKLSHHSSAFCFMVLHASTPKTSAELSRYAAESSETIDVKTLPSYRTLRHAVLPPSFPPRQLR